MAGALDGMCGMVGLIESERTWNGRQRLEGEADASGTDRDALDAYIFQS
jgi:hypothetical protein